MTLPANWATGNTFTAAAENAVEAAVNALYNNGQLIAAAPTGVAATDTANIQAAINALPSTGGDVILQSGTYQLTATGLSIASSVRLRGVGSYAPQGAGFSSYGTQLQLNSVSATAITVAGNVGVAIENMSITNNATGTSGYGIQFSGGGDLNDSASAHISQVNIIGFYNGIVIGAWTELYNINQCEIRSPNYGIFVDNTGNVDEGDGTIFGNSFFGPGSGSNYVAAIFWQGGGGCRISHNKFNGNFTYAIAFDGGGSTTSDLFVHDNSFEAATAGTGTAIQLVGSTLYTVMVSGNQFLNWYYAVNFDGTYYGTIITGNVGNTITVGIYLESGTPAVLVGPNAWVNTTTPVQNNGSGSNVIYTQLST